MLSKKILSLQHPLVTHWKKLVEVRAYREETKSLILTGKTLLHEIQEHFPIKALITTDETSTLNGATSYLVTKEILKKITSLSSSDGFAAEVAMPKEQDLSKTSRLLILDGISDPGNLGTLIRSAYCLGWEGVVITPNSTDLFNDKALRAAKGATLHLPFCRTTVEKVMTWGHQLYSADMSGEPLTKLTITEKFALILSSESRGARDFEHCKYVQIPMQKGADSLNVAAAGAILLYALRKQ
jgi:TrmH family RNA methyltransferase